MNPLTPIAIGIVVTTTSLVLAKLIYKKIKTLTNPEIIDFEEKK